MHDGARKAWTPDRYPARCRACAKATELVLRWNVAGEVRVLWDGVQRKRVNLVQPRTSTARCGECGSSEIVIGPAQVA